MILQVELLWRKVVEYELVQPLISPVCIESTVEAPRGRFGCFRPYAARYGKHVAFHPLWDNGQPCREKAKLLATKFVDIYVYIRG